MPKKTKTEGSTLISSAKAVGSAAGKLAALVGVTADTTPRTTAKTASKGKLQKKDRHRLPRREKKAQQRSHATQA